MGAVLAMDVMHKITYMQLLTKTVVLVLRVQINKKPAVMYLLALLLL